MAVQALPPGQRPPNHPDLLSPIFWRDGRVVMIDQRRLPDEEIWTAYDTWEDVARAIADMEVRGAPAIGCAGAFAVALAVGSSPSAASLRQHMRQIGETRPTAVNLGAAVHRMANAIASGRDAVAEAQAIWDEDLAACRAIGAHGAALLPDEGTVLTHCNAGALATAGYGTALGVIRAAVAAGKRLRVLCDETRPFLQGARLTAWELTQDGIPAEVIVDGAARALPGQRRDRGRGGRRRPHRAQRRRRQQDRHARRRGLRVAVRRAVLRGRAAHHARPQHRRPARGSPSSRGRPTEITQFGERRVVPAAAGVRNPVFDVTPARLVKAIITETGVYRAPYAF